MRDADLLLARQHAQPHGYLGAHSDNGSVVVRAFRPAAANVTVVAGGKRESLECVHPGGVFEGRLDGEKLPLHYQLEVDYGDSGTVTIEDPYRFLPTLGELDMYLLGEGRHEELWERLGAHVREVDGVAGTAFAVWAPGLACPPVRRRRRPSQAAARGRRSAAAAARAPASRSSRSPSAPAA